MFYLRVTHVNAELLAEKLIQLNQNILKLYSIRTMAPVP